MSQRPQARPIAEAEPWKTKIGDERYIIARFNIYWVQAHWISAAALWYSPECCLSADWQQRNQPEWFIEIPEVPK